MPVRAGPGESSLEHRAGPGQWTVGCEGQGGGGWSLVPEVCACQPVVDAGRQGWGFRECGLFSASLLLFPQQLHGPAGCVDLRLLCAHAARPGFALLFCHELRYLQGLPDEVGDPGTVDETGPPAVGEPCSSPSARTAGPTAAASPWCPTTSPPGCAHSAGRHTQPTPDDLPEFICLVSVCKSSLGGLDSSIAAAFGPQATWLFFVLTVRQGGLKATHVCVATHVCLEKKPKKTGCHLSFLVAKAKGEIGWLFKFLWPGQRKESLLVMGRRDSIVRSGNKSKSIF